MGNLSAFYVRVTPYVDPWGVPKYQLVGRKELKNIIKYNKWSEIS